MDINKLQTNKLLFENAYFGIEITGKSIKNCTVNQKITKYYYRILNWIKSSLHEPKWLNNATVRKMLAEKDDLLTRIESALSSALPNLNETIDPKEKKLVDECRKLQIFLESNLNQIHRENDQNDLRFFLDRKTKGFLQGYLICGLSSAGTENAVELLQNGVTFAQICDHLKIPYTTYADARGRTMIDFADDDHKKGYAKILSNFFEDKERTKKFL